MPLAGLGWVFVAALALHNLDEAIWLPRWSRRFGRLELDRNRFRLAALLVLLIAAGVAAGLSLAPHGPWRGPLGGSGLVMALNALLPPLALSLGMRRSMPGTATGLLLSGPAGLLLAAAVAARSAWRRCASGRSRWRWGWPR